MSQLLRFPSSVKPDPAIEVWIHDSGELGAIAQRWFEIMRACGDDVRELLHDGHPTACVGDAAFGYVNAFKAHVNVGFFRGAEIADPDGLLEGTGRFICVHRYEAAPKGGASQSRFNARSYMNDSPSKRGAVFLRPGQGRPYSMGRMNAVYKADGDETRSHYEVSEWSLDPHTHGPGAHSHANDDIFYVLEGTMSFLVGDAWVDAPRGSFVLVPGGMTHDFKNASDDKATILNIGVPGGFEKGMPNVVQHFAKNPPGDA